MGAKQSKRSVDISGKEADGASEVAAGAGGEGRVEQLADADALKPQLNGDAHIHETSEKEKQIDSSTPENEKDATTEKEGKGQDDEKDKESSVITNGDNDQKEENGESTPSPEETKKPKKEKVKKKWSLRSISFSRKDKPKQEKKQKEDESKTNGEPEKVPEEAAEASPENEKNEVIQEIKSETESKDDKTPETPVTEPITNGSNTPETPKDDISTPDEQINVTKDTERAEAPKEVEPDQLPLNSCTLEEPKHETADPVETAVDRTSAEINAEKPEPIPAIEIPDKNEVCVEKSPLIEPTPPPLPANPPPSSVASFAVSTMAPELTDASLTNTADVTATAAPTDRPEPNSDIKIDVIAPENEHIKFIIETEPVEKLKNTEEKLKETSEADVYLTNVKKSDEAIIDEYVNDTEIHVPVLTDISKVNSNSKVDVISNDNVGIENDVVTLPETDIDDLSVQGVTCGNNVEIADRTVAGSNNKKLESIECDVALEGSKFDAENSSGSNQTSNELTQNDASKEENMRKDSAQKVENVECFAEESIKRDVTLETKIMAENSFDSNQTSNGLTQNDASKENNMRKDSAQKVENVECIALASIEMDVELGTKINAENGSNLNQTYNGHTQNASEENMGKDSTEKVEDVECNRLDHKKMIMNGDATNSVPVITPEDAMPPSLSAASELPPAGDAEPDGSDCLPQELISASDKMTELIPEIPSVPELKTELETTTDVAVAN